MRAAFTGDLGRTVAVAVAVAAIAVSLQLVRAWDALDDLVFDAFTVAAVPRGLAPGPVVVVGIDEASFSEIGLRWPWPRDLHARLAEELARAGARVVVFDVLFSEPSDPAADAALARAVRDTGRVVLAGDMVYQETPQFRGMQRIEPLPELREAGAAVGIASVEVGADQVVRTLPSAPDALWRVALERWGGAPVPEAAAGTRIRYSDGSDIPYVSYYQALDAGRMLAPGTFRGKIALVGLALKTTADPLRRGADTFATPFLRFSKLYAPGVEVQAQFVAAAQANRVIVPLSWAWTLALAALALAAAIAAMNRWRAGRAALVAGGGSLLALAACFALFAFAHRWLPVALPCGLLAGLYVGRGSTAYLDELRRKREMRRAFERYVSPDVVSEVTAHPERLALGGERRELTVMFTDLAGFTSMSEGMAPEAVVALLNEHLTRMADIVLRHGGTIDKFIGDAVMAFWGAPLPDARHARHAVEAAIEMQAEMERWRREPGGPAGLHMRIGLNTATVVVGNLGSRKRFDYTVVGDGVNLASRLESANRFYGTSILLTAAVAERLGGGPTLRYVDRIRVKGKSLAVEIYTPHADAALAGASDAAVKAYQARDWDRSESQWRRVLELDPRDAIAALYLDRIAALRRAGVPADWDATLDLDQK